MDQVKSTCVGNISKKGKKLKFFQITNVAPFLYLSQSIFDISTDSNQITSRVDSALNCNMNHYLHPNGATAEDTVVVPSQPQVA